MISQSLKSGVLEQEPSTLGRAGVLVDWNWEALYYNLMSEKYIVNSVFLTALFVYFVYSFF